RGGARRARRAARTARAAAAGAAGRVMRRTPPLLRVAATAIPVSRTTRRLPDPARVRPSRLVAGLPPLSVAQARALERVQLPSRLALYTQTALSLWMLAGATAAVAFASSIPARALGLVWLPLAETLLWTGALTAGGVALMLLA